MRRRSLAGGRVEDLAGEVVGTGVEQIQGYTTLFSVW